MSKAVTILAIVGSFIFGMWYFNKAGCDTDIEALCWNGPSIEEMIGGAVDNVKGATAPGGEDFIPVQRHQGITPASRKAGGSQKPATRADFFREMSQCTPGESEDKCQRRVLASKSSSMAHAYYINNTITVA